MHQEGDPLRGDLSPQMLAKDSSVHSLGLLPFVCLACGTMLMPDFGKSALLWCGAKVRHTGRLQASQEPCVEGG